MSIFFFSHIIVDMAIYMDQALDSNLNLSDSIMSSKPILFTLRWAHKKRLFTYYVGTFPSLADVICAQPLVIQAME